jgi:hypothetical protein
MNLVTHLFRLLDINDYSSHVGGFRNPYKELRSEHLSAAGVVWQGRVREITRTKGKLSLLLRSRYPPPDGYCVLRNGASGLFRNLDFLCSVIVFQDPERAFSAEFCVL